MKRFWEAAYSFVVIPFFWIVVRGIGLVNAKTRRGIRGRDTLFADLERQIALLAPGPASGSIPLRWGSLSRRSR